MTTGIQTSGHDVIDVSVIMPAWKSADFIEASIESVLDSQGVSLELIIVDDASPDDTFAVVQRCAASDPRIRIDRLERNGGPSAARNRALELAQGRYVAVVDSDDTLAKARLQKLVGLADEGDHDIVIDNMIEVSADGDRLSDKPFLNSSTYSRPTAITLDMYVRANQPMKGGDNLGYLKPLFRRATLERLNARYDEQLRNSEDYYLVATLLAQGASMTYTPYQGYFYRRAASSTSHRLTREQTAAWLVAEEAFQARFSDQQDTTTLRQLRARARGLREVDQFVRALDAIREKRFMKLASVLGQDLRAAKFTLGWFGRIGLQRLARLAPAWRRAA